MYVTGKIYPYVQFVSVMFLVVSFCVYALLPEMRNTHGIIIFFDLFRLIEVLIYFSNNPH